MAVAMLRLCTVCWKAMPLLCQNRQKALLCIKAGCREHRGTVSGDSGFALEHAFMCVPTCSPSLGCCPAGWVRVSSLQPQWGPGTIFPHQPAAVLLDFFYPIRLSPSLASFWISPESSWNPNSLFHSKRGCLYLCCNHRVYSNLCLPPSNTQEAECNRIITMLAVFTCVQIPAPVEITHFLKIIMYKFHSEWGRTWPHSVQSSLLSHVVFPGFPGSETLFMCK